MPSIKRSDLAAACGLAALTLGALSPILRGVLHPVGASISSALSAVTRSVTLQPVTQVEINRNRTAVRRQDQSGEKGEISHRFLFPDGTTAVVSDHPKKPHAQAHRVRVVAFRGSAPAWMEPYATFAAAGQNTGLSSNAIEALQYVSRHEGGFDAVNTWDGARFSWGFVQFAGGYGLPGALAYLKTKEPALFRSLFTSYGVDVLPGAAGQPVCAYYDGATRKVLTGSAAEQAYGDDLLTVALFVRAGQNPKVKQRQIEAAIRDYVDPALQATHGQIRLSSVLCSPKGMAALIDQQIQVGNQRRLGRALQTALLRTSPRYGFNPAVLEGSVLRLAVHQTGRAVPTRRFASAIHTRLWDILYSPLPGPI